MTAAVFGSPLSNLLPSGGYGRLAEVRAVVGFILSFLVPAFVPFLREPAPFLLYLAGVAYLANKHKTGTFGRMHNRLRAASGRPSGLSSHAGMSAFIPPHRACRREL